MALRNLDDDEKSYIVRTDLGLRPGKDMLIVNEPGLYSLILRSRKPQAKAFKRNPTDSGRENPSVDHAYSHPCDPSDRWLLYRDYPAQHGYVFQQRQVNQT